MAAFVDVRKGQSKPVVAMVVGVVNNKRTFMASASKAANEAGIDCGKVFGTIVRELGGRGGGKANFARGSLPDDISYDDLIQKSRTKIRESQT